MEPSDILLGLLLVSDLYTATDRDNVTDFKICNLISVFVCIKFLVFKVWCH